jgi:hypothetical protein
MKTYKMPGEPATKPRRRQLYLPDIAHEMMDEIMDERQKRDGRAAPQHKTHLITQLLEHELDRLQMEK